MASWKMQMSQVCADGSPLDGARDLFCIFSLTNGGTVASAVEHRKPSRSSRLIEAQVTPHVDALYLCYIYKHGYML